MSKSQSSNVDGRCDGDEMSVRDQRGRTSPSDRVKEDVSQEYFTLSNKTVILIVKEAMSWVGWWKFYYTRRDRRCKEGRQTNCQNISGVEGAFGLPQKFPEISKYN